MGLLIYESQGDEWPSKMKLKWITLLNIRLCFSGCLVSTTWKETQCCLMFCSLVSSPLDSTWIAPLGLSSLQVPLNQKLSKKNPGPMPTKDCSIHLLIQLYPLLSLAHQSNLQISSSFSTLSFRILPTLLSYLITPLVYFPPLFYFLNASLLKFYHSIFLGSS